MSETHDPNEVIGTVGTDMDDVQRQVEMDRVKNLQQEMKQARDFDEPARKQYAVDRHYAAGLGEEYLVSTNLIGTFIDILMAFLYARDPDVVARKAEHVEIDPQVRLDAIRKDVGQQAEQESAMTGLPPDPMAVEMAVQAQYTAVLMEDRSEKSESAAFTQTLELVISRLWRDGRLKKAARKMVRSALSVGPGWLKVIINIDKRSDPVVESQLNDAQENLQRIEQLKREMEDPQDTGDMEVKASELRTTIAGLEKNVEVVLRKGLAIDFCRAEDVQVSLDVADLEDYLEANWINNRTYVPKKELAGMFPRLSEEELKEATTYQQRSPKDAQKALPDMAEGVSAKDADRFTTGAGTMTGNAGENQEEFGCIVELWDRRDNHIKTIIEGVKRWAREPYVPKQQTRRFYPYFYLAFYEVDDHRHPQSLSSRLKKLQDEYNSTRSSFRKTRGRAIPGIIFNAEQVDQENARKLADSVEQEYVGIKSKNPNIPFRDLFAEKPVVRVDPNLFSVEPILNDMEKVSGVQEALQQSVATPKTATEAEIQQSGFAARSSADRDMLEEVLTDLAQYTAEVALQALDVKDAKRIAGPAAFWPEGMDPDDITTMVEVEIEAGSTGKPNTAAEREAWSVAMPLIKEEMMAIGEFRAAGNEAMASALTELLRETLNRMGDRIDVERFIPQTSPMGMPTGPAGTGPEGAPVEGAANGGGPPMPEGEPPIDQPTEGVRQHLPMEQ